VRSFDTGGGIIAIDTAEPNPRQKTKHPLHISQEALGVIRWRSVRIERAMMGGPGTARGRPRADHRTGFSPPRLATAAPGRARTTCTARRIVRG
jgi:hypothetical protein